MLYLPATRNAWNSPQFREVLKRELEQLAPGQLPLQQALSYSSHALDDKITAIVLAVTDEQDFILAKVGVFFSGVVAGCSCADDPTPIEPQSEYCVMRLGINKATAEASVTLAEDEYQSAI